jgi:hypothetical protein
LPAITERKVLPMLTDVAFASLTLRAAGAREVHWMLKADELVLSRMVTKSQLTALEVLSDYIEAHGRLLLDANAPTPNLDSAALTTKDLYPATFWN